MTRMMTAFVLVGAGAMVTPGALAQTAGTTAGLSGTSGAVAPGSFVGEAMAKANALAAKDRWIEAEAAIAPLMDPTTFMGLSADERREVSSLSTSLKAKIRSADPGEVSLQRAELAVGNGELSAAEVHARKVLGRSGVSETDRARAESVLRTIALRRAELAPLAPSTVEQAIRDFEGRRYAQSKALLASITRSGVELDAGHRRLVDQYQMRILDLERQNGAPFELAAGEVTLSLLQPGSVRRTNDGNQGNAQPEQPAGAPEQPAAAPAPTRAQEDVIQAALRADAQRTLAEADAAFADRRYSEAAQKYSLTLNQNRGYFSEAELARAQQRMTEAQVSLQQGAVGGIAQGVIQNQELVRQRTRAQFNSQIEAARRALSAGDTGAARDFVAAARLTAAGGSDSFSEAENAEFRTITDRLSQEINVTSEQIAARTAAERERQLAQTQADAQRLAGENRQRQINERLDRIRALQRELKYEEALQVVDEVLFLDPINPSGLLLRDALADIVIYRRYYETQRLKGYRHANLTLENEEAMVPPGGLYEYPTDWPAKSFQRGEQTAYAEAPEDRRVLAELDTRRIPVNFSDNTLADVLAFIETVTQVDMDVDWPSLNEIGVQREALITLKLTNVPIRVALDRVLEKAGRDQFARAGWAVSDGVLRIASDQDLRRNTTLVIYNITDLLLEIPSFYDAPQIDLQGVLQQSQGGGGGGGQSPFTQDQNQQMNPEEREQRRQERIQQIVQIIQNNVDFDGWRDNGGDTGTVQELNGNLIVRNTPRNHGQITSLLSKLREMRSMQINVETKFLLVNQDWFEQIGFDIDVVFNANNNQVRAARAVDPTIQPRDFFNFGTPGPGGRGLVRTVTGAVVDDDATQVGVVRPRAWSPIGAQQNSLGLGAGLAAGNEFAAGILGAAPALGIAGQFLDDIQVDFLIQATQADRRSVQLTAPRMTFTNGQVANIFVVTQQAFVSDLEPVVGDSAVGFDPEVAVASEGVTMLVEGVISADRRYVTMTVDAGVSRIDGFGREPVTAVAGGQLVNSADTQSFIQLPTITVTRVRTTVTVPDEGTILLGGQRLVTELEIETGVPVLSKIPIINRFFTNRIESKEEQTLLILLKPTIIIQAEEEERAFPGLNDALRTGGFGAR